MIKYLYPNLSLNNIKVFQYKKILSKNPFFILILLLTYIQYFTQFFFQFSKLSIIQFQNCLNLMEGWDQEFKKTLADLNIHVEGIQQIATNKEDQKKLKKKYKKNFVDSTDNVQTAAEKTRKMLQQVYNIYKTTAKQSFKTSKLQSTVDLSKTERDSSYNMLKMTDSLQKNFRKKYEETMKKAELIQEQEEGQRKKLIQQLQNRIKVVQEQYEASGKVKIQKYRENQTLKHEISKLQPQTLTTQSLMDAHLKKKQIQIQIQMTTMKQKIQMMNNFKKMGQDTRLKLEASEALSKKIETRLGILDGKQNENKIVVARAHLILQQYRKAITKINGLLSKHEKQAQKAKQTLAKKRQSTQDIDKTTANIEKECETQRNQIQILLTMQQNLKKELAQ